MFYLKLGRNAALQWRSRDMRHCACETSSARAAGTRSSACVCELTRVCEGDQWQHVKINTHRNGTDSTSRNHLRTEARVQREARQEQSLAEAEEVHHRALGESPGYTHTHTPLYHYTHTNFLYHTHYMLTHTSILNQTYHTHTHTHGSRCVSALQRVCSVVWCVFQGVLVRMS